MTPPSPDKALIAPHRPTPTSAPAISLWPSAAQQKTKENVQIAAVAEGAGPAAKGTQRDPSAASPAGPSERRTDDANAAKGVPANVAG